MHMRLRIIRELRKQIFAFQEAAESSLELESQQQLRTAAALKLLEMRLRDTGITPDNFDEFDDKEYVRNVIKYINTNAARLYAKCATTEQSAIEDVLAAITVLPEYDYYLQNYPLYKQWVTAKERFDATSEQTKSISSKGCLFAIVGFLGVCTAFGAFVVYSVGDNKQAAIAFILIGLSALVVALVLQINQRKTLDEIHEIKKAFESLDKKTNSIRMRRNEELRGSPAIVELLRLEAHEAFARVLVMKRLKYSHTRDLFGEDSYITRITDIDTRAGVKEYSCRLHAF